MIKSEEQEEGKDDLRLWISREETPHGNMRPNGIKIHPPSRLWLISSRARSRQLQVLLLKAMNSGQEARSRDDPPSPVPDIPGQLPIITVSPLVDVTPLVILRGFELATPRTAEASKILIASNSQDKCFRKHRPRD